jgi:uncharacterized protein YciI
MIRNSMVAWMGMAVIALAASACSTPKCPPSIPVALVQETSPPAESATSTENKTEQGSPKAAEGQAKPEPDPKEKMRTYYMGLLRRGPAWSAERTPEVVAISKGHMDHIGEMAKSGALLVAGPFLDAKGPGDLVGVFIFGVATLDEARALAEADPAVKAGRFTVEVKPWMAGVGLRVDP